METEWLPKKVEQYFEENDPEDMITTDYKEVSALVFEDALAWDIWEEIKFSNSEMKMMINEISLDRLRFLTNYLAEQGYEMQYEMDENKPEYGLVEDDYREILGTIIMCYRQARYDY
jgi:hypothetical protein